MTRPTTTITANITAAPPPAPPASTALLAELFGPVVSEHRRIELLVSISTSQLELMYNRFVRIKSDTPPLCTHSVIVMRVRSQCCGSRLDIVARKRTNCLSPFSGHENSRSIKFSVSTSHDGHSCLISAASFVMMSFCFSSAL